MTKICRSFVWQLYDMSIRFSSFLIYQVYKYEMSVEVKLRSISTFIVMKRLFFIPFDH